MSDYVPSSGASSSRAWKYEVFLSFRGEDTRRSFVSHLYNALEQKGIHVFKDDERLEVGKTISNELMKAIQESRFAVVVFSKSYASSKWCLEELAHIIKCKKELDLNVIPIFYDVNPTDVRHQKSPFNDSFSEHEKSCKDDMEKVQRWRDAFAEAGNCSGYHLEDLKDEVECIKKVVDHIFPKLLQVSSPFPEGLVGIAQVEKVISLLDPKSDDVRFFGLHGMGGIGKTEIAHAIYEKYLPDFDAGCFLEDVGEKCLTERLLWLQQDLIHELLGEEKRFTSVHQGAQFVQQRLRIKKALLVLDGVSHQEQLEWLARDPQWFGKGSKIIVTARDKHLLISHVGDNVYEVQLLTAEESLELFSRHAFREKSPKEAFMELSRQVVEYAGGLPLALKVLGSTLHKRDKEQWEDIIDRLKKIPNNDIVGKLRISFDGLAKDIKEIFLDFACLYKNDYGDYVKLVFQSRDIPLIRLDYLVEKSLLSRSRYYDGYEMHNLIRKMGENVSREEYPNIRIWLNEKVDDLFAGKLKTEKVEILSIQKSYEFEDDPVKISKVFKRMKSLQVLRIEDGTFSSNCTVTHLPSSLRFVDLSGYLSSSLLENFKPSQLVVLILRRSLLVELFPIPKKLSNLKYLDLSYSLQLTKTPNFGDIPNLETLILRGCENLEEVHPSLGHCSMLKVLNLWHCTKLQKLPKFVSMLSLKILNLSKCTSLKKFPKISRPLQSLSELSLESPWIRSLPSYLGDLRDLELINCEVLESIPHNIGQNLKSLHIEGCNKLAMLPPSLEVQSELVSIYITDCENLKKLPNSIKMESLEHLEISNCPKLDTFPEINGDMQHLSYLILESTAINGELTSSIGNLSGLTELKLTGWKDLVSLPNNICNLKNLQRLYLSNCKKLEKLPENIGDLQQLKVLGAKMTAISRLPPSIVKLTKLERLSLSNCNILGRLPEDIGSLHSLEQLDVSGSNISCLPKSISKLLNLRSLNVQFCKSLSELPRELPPNLMGLYVDYFRLKSFRDLLSKCVKLEGISFCESKNVQWVPASTNQNLLKFLGYFLRTFIQCHFPQRKLFCISFSFGGRIPKTFGCNFSINLKPSWYTDNFRGFLICYRCDKGLEDGTYYTFRCKFDDPQGNSGTYSWSCSVPGYTVSHAPFLNITYIPYESDRLAPHCEEGKSPNDYCIFEASTTQIATCWRVYLVYENKGETGFSRAFVPLEPSYSSNHLQVYDEQNIATDMVLHLGYEIEADLEVDQKEYETQNVDLIRVCDGPSCKIGDASRKRKRSNK